MRRELVLSALLLATPAAARAPAAITFSDLCTEGESGDVGGRFVRLDPRATGAAVTYGYTEGALMAPVRAHDVLFEPTTGALSFAVMTWTRLRFQGRVTPRALLGRLQVTGTRRLEAVRLARVRSIRGPYPPCS